MSDPEEVALVINHALWILVPVAILSACVVFVITRWRRERQEAELADTIAHAALQRHDQWRQTASRRAFELHKRECPRCRGDLLGQNRYVDPPATRGRSHA